jgi:uncharacterized Zn finger protein (UPF0148 family)
MNYLKVFCLLCAFAMFTGLACAETANEDLPTQGEISNFIAGIPVSNNYISTVFETVKDQQPTWKCDIWEDQNGIGYISLYYTSDSSRGYGSVYYNENGNIIGPSCGVTYKLIDSYKGESVSNVETEKEASEEEPEEEEDEGVEEDSKQTYSDLTTFLDEDDTNEQSYSKSKACANALISALEEDGWNAELVRVVYISGDKKYSRYIAEVETSDEGTVYIDSYGGIDKRVTQLEKGEQWLAESACGTCPHDSEGKYNKGIVTKITYP